MIKVNQDVALKQLSTMMTEGTADYVVEWESIDDLKSFMTDDRYAEIRRRGVKPIGGGSNMLFVTRRLEGVLLKCVANSVKTVSDEGKTMVIQAVAGMVLDDLVAYCCNQKLWGIENLSLIPGTVGGAAVQNVGAYGVEFKDVVLSVDCFDLTTLNTITYTLEDIGYGYRDSMFKREGNMERLVVTSVTLRLSKSPAPRLEYGQLADIDLVKSLDLDFIREKIIELRRSKLPEVGRVGSAGSFFKNPIVTDSVCENVVKKTGPGIPVYDLGKRKKLSAAWLIDKAGWKGVTIGHAGVWPLQPLVLVNADGQASGDDIARLAEMVCADVEAKFGVRLSTEVEYIY